jgi:hypothetical protein
LIPKEKPNDISRDEDLFSGRGAPALMSTKEPAIRMMKERYAESFAITRGSRQGQVHLFLIKHGMWALVWTFTSNDVNPGESISLGKEKFEVQDALRIIESAMRGERLNIQQKLDLAVSSAQERIRSKLDDMKKSF